ncbi:glycosyltransferase family 4 protein [Chitinophagaceae bacterium LB-8]|uniref:Glycosyltransferase family 4 protein n=1 Tax=Paraflavisolibacter caeni TaxID=2982496 RepID=A0A9X2XZP8_9BACT|nr:glycosyltransferase family 4 protein [Paraflavisolibacter caeni]MCU7551877.1 glycosyltransferase family 4 protein [Paraflavisolibacter caeni]
MKIAQVAPLYEAVPPKLYGGTERVVYNLTEELVRQGHEVTLFASGDSRSSGILVSNVKQALRLNPGCEDPLAHHIVQLQEVLEHAKEFDVIHFHTDYLHFPLTENLNTPHVTTLHGRLDIPDLQNVYNKFTNQPVISISNTQRKPLPQANFIATIHHGLPFSLFQCGKGEGGYLAVLGRVSPEKGFERAIEIAKTAGIQLKIAAKVDKIDKEYFEREIKHLLDHPLIEFIGEINETEKQEFLGNAMALLFPINWCEPFGLVMIEAMACGTPVIAYPMGSVPEVIQPGKSGFIVNNLEEAVAAVQQIAFLPRNIVRQTFEEKFTVERMAKDYLAVYIRMIKEKEAEIEMQLHDSKAFPISLAEKSKKAAN